MGCGCSIVPPPPSSTQRKGVSSEDSIDEVYNSRGSRKGRPQAWNEVDTHNHKTKLDKTSSSSKHGKHHHPDGASAHTSKDEYEHNRKVIGDIKTENKGEIEESLLYKDKGKGKAAELHDEDSSDTSTSSVTSLPQIKPALKCMYLH